MRILMMMSESGSASFMGLRLKGGGGSPLIKKVRKYSNYETSDFIQDE